MNFLALCKRARQEAGISGGGPSTVVGQSGQLAKLVDWTAQAWEDIQLMRPNWEFMWNEATITLDGSSAQRDFDPEDSAVNVGRYDTDTFIFAPSAATTEQFYLQYLAYRSWRRGYKVDYLSRTDERPTMFTILPNKKIRIEPGLPAEVTTHTLSFEYYRRAQLLAADTDEPTNLPDDFHMIIVWQALKYYGFYEDAPDVLDEAETNFDNLLYRLENDQLPEMSEDFEALA